MLKNEFIEMMKQDLITNQDETLNNLLLCVEEVLKDYPNNTDIDSSITIESIYKKMENYARSNKKGTSYCFTPEATKKFIIDCLGLKESARPINFVKLEDFI